MPTDKCFVSSLDHAVKSLTDIWTPEHIPPIFRTSTRISLASACTATPSATPCVAPAAVLTRRPALQLLSPCSPTTQPSPPPPSSLTNSLQLLRRSPWKHDLCDREGPRPNVGFRTRGASSITDHMQCPPKCAVLHRGDTLEDT